MAENLIQRVASILSDLAGQHEWQRYSDDAFAIVRDIREPTSAMIAAAEGKSGAESWKAMIDQALSENPLR